MRRTGPSVRSWYSAPHPSCAAPRISSPATPVPRIEVPAPGSGDPAIELRAEGRIHAREYHATTSVPAISPRDLIAGRGWRGARRMGGVRSAHFAGPDSLGITIPGEFCQPHHFRLTAPIPHHRNTASKRMRGLCLGEIIPRSLPGPAAISKNSAHNTCLY